VTQTASNTPDEMVGAEYLAKKMVTLDKDREW